LYKVAVEEKYRFFSYGDSMLLNRMTNPQNVQALLNNLREKLRGCDTQIIDDPERF
jgi:hypothetical protein